MSRGLTLAAAILTFDRPVEVRLAVESCRRPGIDRVLVLDNGGAEPVGELPGATVLRSDENLGVCAGRNLLVDALDSDLVLFVDDDGLLEGASDLGRVVALFESDPTLAVVAGVVRREDGSIAAHEFPRRRVTGVEREGEVGYFVGAACVVRRSAFLAVGGFDPAFFYAHEETDLSLRLARRGWSILYSPALRFEHRPSASGRVTTAGTTARRFVNREVLARRSLPVPVRWIHVAIWWVHSAVTEARAGKGRYRSFLAQSRAIRSERFAAEHFLAADRLRLRDALALQRRGFRVLW